MRHSFPWSVGDQQPVPSVMRRRRKSLFHIEFPRLCFLHVRSAGMIGTFGGDPSARRLLGGRWRHCGVRMQGVLRPSEHKAENALILWTDEKTLPQTGQENVNPALVGQQRFAVLTRGGGSGGRSGPISSV
ncbi:hypothetical protein TcCL_NonESM03732 [Trypanosoma cruzi]|nr:hypothetical protein TcCL_NonESM03732 [Trypanosoma cruzi]